MFLNLFKETGWLSMTNLGYRFLICDSQNKWQISGTFDFSVNFKRDSIFIKNPYDFKIKFNSNNPLLTR